jgi:hypothetical protein
VPLYSILGGRKMSIVEKWINEIKEIFRLRDEKRKEINKELLKRLYEEEINLLKEFCKEKEKTVYIRSSNVYLPISCKEALKYLEEKIEKLSS